MSHLSASSILSGTPWTMWTPIEIRPCSQFLISRKVDEKALRGNNRLLLYQVTLLLFGVTGNILMLCLLCGRKKLETASFTYLRIQSIFQLLFFLLPFILKILSEFDSHGDSWLSTNFLPIFIGVSHLNVAAICCCFVFRLQLIINCLRRSRTWNSYVWIAWRKVCWLAPISVAVSIPLCFEHYVEYRLCLSRDGEHMELVGVARLSHFGETSSLMMETIRALPTLIYWWTVICAFAYLVCERCLQRRTGSPITKKHLPFFSNLRPFLLAVVISPSIVHIPSTVAYMCRSDLNQKLKLLLYAFSYASPPFLMLTLSPAFREHFRLTIYQSLLRTSREISQTQLTNSHTSGRLLNELPTYSRLEIENSEVDDRRFGGRNSAVREALHADAVRRVRFALPTALSLVIIQEDANTLSVDNEKKELRSHGGETV